MSVVLYSMRHPRLLAAAVLTIFAVGGVAVWAWADPLPAIRAELQAAAADAKNHAPYAELVRAELAAAGRLKTTTFEMPCFWAGESHFGGLPGVYRTTPGMQAGREAVRVDYDPTVTSPEALLAAPPDPAAIGRGCRYDPAATAGAATDPAFKPDDLAKWSIRQTDGLKCVPMTPAQAARVNADFHSGRSVEPWLSPAQNALLTRVRANTRGGWTEYVGDERLWDSLRKRASATAEKR